MIVILKLCQHDILSKIFADSMFQIEPSREAGQKESAELGRLGLEAALKAGSRHKEVCVIWRSE